MPRVLVLLLTLLAATTLASRLATPFIDAPVTDLAGVLSPEQETRLAERLAQHRATTGVQLALLFVDSTDDESMEDFALRVAMKWGGGEKRRDDGALFVMAVKDRHMRLEVGYGLEPLVPDGVAAGLLEDLKPQLRDGDYDAAMTQLVERLTNLTRGGVYVPPPVAAPPPLLPGWVGDLVRLVNVPWVLLFLGALALGRWLRARHAWSKGVELSEGTFLSVPQLIVAVAVLIGVLTALSGLLGFGLRVWWGAAQGVLVGAFVLHDKPLPAWLLYVGLMGLAPLVADVVSDVPLDQLLFGAIGQGALSLVAILLEFGESPDSSYSSSGVSDWSRRSSRSSSSGFSSGGSGLGSSSRGAASSSASPPRSSSSGGGYRGGGGSFGGGGASSSW